MYHLEKHAHVRKTLTTVLVRTTATCGAAQTCHPHVLLLQDTEIQTLAMTGLHIWLETAGRLQADGCSFKQDNVSPIDLCGNCRQETSLGFIAICQTQGETLPLQWQKLSTDSTPPTSTAQGISDHAWCLQELLQPCPHHPSDVRARKLSLLEHQRDDVDMVTHPHMLPALSTPCHDILASGAFRPLAVQQHAIKHSKQKAIFISL